MRDLFLPGGGPSRLTWRRLGVLIRHLPPESATMTAVRNAQPDHVGEGDPAEGRWSQTEMLLAALVDAINHQSWLYTCAHTPKGEKRPQKPDPVPRPGAQPRRQRKTLTAEQYERLFAHINGLDGGPRLALVKGGKGRRG